MRTEVPTHLQGQTAAALAGLGIATALFLATAAHVTFMAWLAAQIGVAAIAALVAVPFYGLVAGLTHGSVQVRLRSHAPTTPVLTIAAGQVLAMGLATAAQVPMLVPLAIAAGALCAMSVPAGAAGRIAWEVRPRASDVPTVLRAVGHDLLMLVVGAPVLAVLTLGGATGHLGLALCAIPAAIAFALMIAHSDPDTRGTRLRWCSRTPRWS